MTVAGSSIRCFPLSMMPCCLPMKILVCVKEVPTPESRFAFQHDPPGYTETGLSFRMNLYDEYALEEALCLQEILPGSSVTAVSVGPARVQSTIRRALEMGANRGVHLLDESATARDAFGIAAEIASWARDQRFDLILTGMMAEDDQRCQTGPFLACLLGMIYATAVLRFELDIARSTVAAEREREHGFSEILLLPLPALLAVQSSTRQPRYPSLSNKLRAKRQSIEVIREAEGTEIPRLLEMVQVGLPESIRSTVFLSGTPEEEAAGLLDVLERRQLL